MRPQPAPRGSVGAPIGSSPGPKAKQHGNQTPKETTLPDAHDGNILITDSPSGERLEEDAKEQPIKPSSLRANGDSGS
eukprot:6908062-Heterocapsa_arctica.AAC.1